MDKFCSSYSHDSIICKWNNAWKFPILVYFLFKQYFLKTDQIQYTIQATITGFMFARCASLPYIYINTGVIHVNAWIQNTCKASSIKKYACAACTAKLALICMWPAHDLIICKLDTYVLLCALMCTLCYSKLYHRICYQFITFTSKLTKMTCLCNTHYLQQLLFMIYLSNV